MWVKIVSIGFWIMNLVNISYCSTYIYKRSYDIYDHQNWNERNWKDQNAQSDCEGLVLPQQAFGLVIAKKLEIRQLVFGKHVILDFEDDTDIIFNEESKTVMNCVTLNSTEMQPHFWHDGRNWMLIGKEDNRAVPDFEKIPGVYDDAILPKGVLSGPIYVIGDVSIKSLKFGTEQWTNDDYGEHKKDPTLNSILTDLSGGLNIKNMKCLDESGCDHGNEIPYRNYCHYVDSIETFDCVNPIEAIGFCNKICGASIVFGPSSSFKIKAIEEMLQNFYSDTHVSKVRNRDGYYVIQIIFTEKEFTGSSLQEAEEFHSQLLKDKIIQSVSSEFLQSGTYSKKGSTAKSVLSSIFGSLAGVCLIFGLLFLIFNNDRRFASIRERIGLGQGPLTYRSIFFSRNLSISEGSGLIVDGQSVRGSVPNVKSFENPSFSEFKEKSPSTSESSDNLEQDNANDNLPEIFESDQPDLFEDQERRGLIETVAEEGELVDLSEMK